jgi:hypothetical protein
VSKSLTKFILLVLVGTGSFILSGCIQMLACLPVLRESFDATVSSGREYASILRLPGGSHPRESWIAKGNPSRFDWGTRFEFREDPLHENQLFVRAYAARDSEGTYSFAEHGFALDCRHGVTARVASEDGWARAKSVSRPGWRDPSAPQLDRTAVDDGNFFVWEGKRYKHTGAQAAGFIVSPAIRRIAIISFDRARKNSGYNQPNSFSYFLDFYDHGSQERIASAQGYVKSFRVSQAEVDEELDWVTDRYFFLPLNAEHDKLLFFDFGPSH